MAGNVLLKRHSEFYHSKKSECLLRNYGADTAQRCTIAQAHCVQQETAKGEIQSGLK